MIQNQRTNRYIIIECRSDSRAFFITHTTTNLFYIFFISVQPVWWNPSSNGGFGDWSPDFCQLINAKSNLVWFNCSRLGYYGYRFSRVALDSRSVSGSGFRLHHPVTYACAAVCISVLLLSIMVRLL